MKHSVIAAVLGVAIATFQTTTWAVDAEWAQKELKSHKCLTCHAIDKKKVGPAYKDVAAENKGKSVADVVAKVKANAKHKSALKKTSDDELNKMVEWILTLK